MGSLMAGWDSHVLDPNDVKLRRNTSLTNGEIDTFWKSKKLKEEEHLKDILLLSPRSQLQRSFFEESDEGNEESVKKVVKKHGWWERSNSAFLNEPPVIQTDGSGVRYASQFHVADMSGSKTQEGKTDGINA